ncbi:H-NS family nucleoid-associated regulatory protein [Bradyrhizobium lablabi]|jgi:DNA-binding protein H-NS|uniref:H-NS histone family protein n=1 Tax=Bradyrhizobium lablabi TaxID=722472 RepID=UPI0009A8D978|nr:H-NS histone family protein [Bradyrhizobium lablabi]
MKLTDFELMSIDELWALHLEIDVVLTRKISAKTNQLGQRLRLLESGASEAKIERERRPYPRVLPKYQNPEKPSETWAGRGKQPRWLTAQLRSGKTLEDFQIRPKRLIGKSRTRSRRKSKPALMAA